MPGGLPSFPTLVDDSAASWTEKEENHTLTALSHCGRVRGIALRNSYMHTHKLFKALSRPFQICPIEHVLVLPATLPLGSRPMSQRLTLRGVVLRFFISTIIICNGLRRPYIDPQN